MMDNNIDYKMDEQIDNGNVKTNINTNRNGFAIASLILGIVSIVLMCIWFIGIPCGILAIIFGILGLKSAKRGLSIAGIITGIIGTILLISILFISLGVYIFNNASHIEEYSMYNDYSSSYYSNVITLI